MTSAALLPPGSVVGGEFTIVRPLDEGGMGAVYVVEQRSTGKPRALKVMHREIVADAVLQRRFEQEARVGARIASEHVVEVLAAGVDATTGLPYLVMELLEGEDLRHRLDRAGPLPPDQVRLVFEQLCHAMGAAHAAGVVHRDIKPENVFLARSRRATGGSFTVKVLDFGIAKLLADAGTRTTRGAVGSPMWMAPEQTAPGPVMPAADVWALGLLAYEMLTGRPFWRAANDEGGTTAQLLREVVLDPIPSAGDRAAEQGTAARLPAGFDAWFERCVAREPAARFADAALAWRAMARMLEAADALAETSVDPSGRGSSRPAAPPAPAAQTGEATPFVAAPRPAPLPQETPVAAVKETAPAARDAGMRGAAAGRAAIALGSLVAAAGLAGGWWLARAGTTKAAMPAAISIPSTTPTPTPTSTSTSTLLSTATTTAGPARSPLPAARPSLSDPAAHAEEALYAVAHRAHFFARDAPEALRAWDAYLAAYPHGRFAPEARYNRAITLIRLGRLAEARTALTPFADGRYGSYRQSEARELLEALDAEDGLGGQ